MSNLRVGFNAYLLAVPGLRGWTRYTINLIAALPSHGVRPVLYSNAPIHPTHLARLQQGAFEVRVAPSMRYVLWENLWLPQQLRQDGIQVFHCPMNYGLPWTTPCPRVVTLHDAIDQIYYSRRESFRRNWRPGAIRARLAHWVARQRANKVITVSNHAKGDIVHYLGVPHGRVRVVYEAADPVFHNPVASEAQADVRLKWGLTRPYFLYLGGWEHRKNVSFLVHAFAVSGLSDVELVLAGGKESERARLLELAGNLGCLACVRFLGFIPDDELPALYAAALAFVYPSEYEGFGLQLVEAMAVGCPVLAARATCLPEILGDGGETFTLNEPTELSDLLKRLATDPGLRPALAARAVARSKAFSWDEAAKQTVAIYQTLVRS